MKSQNQPQTIIALIVLLTLSTVMMISRSVATAQSPQSGDEEFIFGTVGITASQTARLNVVNTATDGSEQTRVLKFLDAGGNVIVDSSGTPVMSTVTLSLGESAYLDLNGAAVSGAGRVQIRALDPTCPGCRMTPFSIIQTLELIDNATGRTEVLYAPAQFIPNGPPTFPPPFGMVGVTSGQTLRVNVTTPARPIAPPNPIRVILSFALGDGALLTNADGHPLQPELTLLPGQSAYFDLSADFILEGETRAEIRPVLLAPNCPGCRIIPTLEVIDDATQKTAVLYAPVGRACGAN